MTANEHGSILGTIRYENRPMWTTAALHLLRLLHLPFWRRKQRQWALESIEVRADGILLREKGNRITEKAIPYTEIRKVWFERFYTGNESNGNTSARIDVIAQNLDVIFSFSIYNRPSDDADITLLEQLHALWKEATWKHYHVVAAVIEHDGRYLCMQKPQTRYAYTSYHWEFPGGKVEQGESEPEALKRELMEEMDYEIEPQHHLTTVEHTYPDFSLTLSCWLCTAQTTEFVRKEHADHKWLTPEEMTQLDWCAADAPVIDKLK